MKPIECTSDYIFFIDENEIYSNSVSYELINDSPDAQDLAGLRVKGWYRVELALGEDLRDNFDARNNYRPDSWYIVKGEGNMMRLNVRLPRSIETYEALISF
jgi:hypothetical protein